jgi:hypothetical protein
VRTSAHLLCVLLLSALVACSGSDASTPGETAPPPSRASTTVDTGSTETTSTPAQTEPPVTTLTSERPTTTETPSPTDVETSTTVANQGGFLPEDLGPRVDSVPGVNSAGEITQLLDGVWIFVATEPDPADPNVVSPLPEDAEILAAYAEAQGAYHEQASQSPLDPQPGERMQAAFADEGQRLAENVLVPESQAGRHLDLIDGIVLRPVVVADPRSDSEAFIFDCQLDGTVFVNEDGSLPEGTTPGVREFPQIASVILQDGEWIVDRLTRDERACV